MMKRRAFSEGPNWAASGDPWIATFLEEARVHEHVVDHVTDDVLDDQLRQLA